MTFKEWFIDNKLPVWIVLLFITVGLMIAMFFKSIFVVALIFGFSATELLKYILEDKHA